MSSTYVADSADSSPAENTVIIIVNDDTGNISVDQEMLQSLLTSKENTTLSVVRVNDDSGGDNNDVNLTVEEIYNPSTNSVLKENSAETKQIVQDQSNSSENVAIKMNGKIGVEKTDPASDTVALDVPVPLLDLDQEEIEKIEHALQSEQARQILGGGFGGILGPTSSEAELDDLLDPELTGEPDGNGVVATISLDHCYSAVEGTVRNVNSAMSSEIDSSDSTTPLPAGSSRCLSPKRRSQRQIDKIELEQLRKIRAENEEFLKKEKEVMNQKTVGKAEETAPVESAPPSNPPITETVASVETPKAPLSRLQTIRQEMQQKILTVEPPVKPKPSTNSQTKLIPPEKSPVAKTPPSAAQNRTGKVADANRVQPTAPSPKKEVKSTPTAADSRVPSKSPATPAQKSQEKASVAANRLSNSGGVTRPRRENRQPPKHLREAFDQLESEGVNLKRMIPKATKLPAQIMEDAPAATEPASASRKSLPEKADEEMHTDDTGNSLPADSTVDTSKANSDDDYDSDDSDNSEDDPERLWCVCREPHNNRFMICCDKCEDWFHGKCVGVTRGMGRELELKGLEWICPRCVRQEYASLYDTIIPQEAEEDKSEDVPEEKPVAKAASKPAEKVEKTPAKSETKSPTKTPTSTTSTVRRVRVNSSSSNSEDTAPRRCVVAGCKSDARPNSVYCSDACIGTHARESLIAMSKEKMKQASEQSSVAQTSSPSGKPEAGKLKESDLFGKLMSQPTPIATKSKAINQLRKSADGSGSSKPANLNDEAPVPVMERKSGKILTGSTAPKVASLEQWLKDNPTYEVIKPASLPRSNSSLKTAVSGIKSSPGAVTAVAAAGATTTTTTTAAGSPSPSVTSQQRRKSLETSKVQKTGRNRLVEEKKEEKVAPDPESMRSSAKTSLKEALWHRCKEASGSAGVMKEKEKEVERVAEEIEEALFRLFNKDVGMKYKAKYRSLIFNIKDAKNQGLFRKIIERKITPGQLVKMTAEELASKELAEWREREAKHQLEIIQKTELEMMTMPAKYLVKSHKGEEIIEDKSETRIKSEERDVVAPVLEMLQDTTSKHKSHLFDLNCQICSGKLKEEELLKDQSKATTDEQQSRKKHHSEADKRREKAGHNKDKDRQSNRKKENSKDIKDSKDGKDSKDSKNHHHSRSRDKDRQKRSKSKEKHHNKHRTERTDKTADIHTKKEVKEEAKVPKEVKEIKEDSKQVKETKSVKDVKEAEPLQKKKDAEHQDIKMSEVTPVEDKCDSNSASDSADGAVQSSQSSQSSLDNNKSAPATDSKKDDSTSKPPSNQPKQEPTSTVSIRTPEQQSPQPGPGLMWKGIVNSSETGKFSVQAFDLSVTFDMNEVDIPGSLDIVGRIRPEMVWDYVNQTRKAGSRDILIVKFSPSTDADKKNYSAFLSHMCKCNRFAVVGLTSKLIKDFYIVPLPKDSPIPLALTSLSIDIKNLDDNRTSMLLGVVVRTRRKRSIDGSSFNSKSSKIAKTSSSASSRSTPPAVTTSSPGVNYIPTARNSKRKEGGSGAAHRSGNGAKHPPPAEMTPASTTVKDVPEDLPYSPGQLLNDSDAVNGTDLMEQQAMLDELNRKIEEQKKQLASMETEVSSSPTLGESIVIPGLEPVIPGLEPSSSSCWNDSSIPAFSNPSPPSPRTENNALNQISIPTNLQEILSSIQKKETEMKQIVSQSEALNANLALGSLGSDRDLRTEFFPPQDVDMRIPPATSHLPDESTVRDPRRTSGAISSLPPAPAKKSLLKQLTDEELLAKAMEMEMEAAGGVAPPTTNPANASTNSAPYFSPPSAMVPGSPIRMPFHPGGMGSPVRPPMGGPPMGGPPMGGPPMGGPPMGGPPMGGPPMGGPPMGGPPMGGPPMGGPPMGGPPMGGPPMGGPPMGGPPMGGPPMGGPPMGGPPHRPFRPPYIRAPHAPYNHPPPAGGGGYRPRHKNNR